MRAIKDFDKFKTDEGLKHLIDFIKAEENKKDVFLGIRENEIQLYVNGGGRFLKLKVNGKKADINKKYIERMTGDRKNLLNREVILNTSKLAELKQAVQNYEKNTPEKDFKQKIINAINTNSDFYAYDIEYRFKAKNDKIQKQIIKQNAQQPDLMLISKPDKNNEICIYMMEIKYGTKSFGGADNKRAGSGIAGHVGSFMRLIRWTKSDCKANISKDEKEHIRENVRKHFLDEVKNIMSFYQKFGLIRNKKFTDIDFNNIKLKNNDDAIQFGFILGDYDDSVEKCFKHYLGIAENGNAKYSVKRLLKDEVERKYDYITLDEMVDIKYITYTKEDEANIKYDANYKIIYKEKFR